MNEPIDQLHADLIIVRDQIRASFNQLKARAAQWEPLPCPRHDRPAARAATNKKGIYAD